MLKKITLANGQKIIILQKSFDNEQKYTTDLFILFYMLEYYLFSLRYDF